MGLDIYLVAENQKKLFPKDYHILVHKKELRHQLSRDFCILISPEDVVTGEYELEQIGRIAQTEIGPFYEMVDYGGETDEEFESRIASIKNKEDRQRIENYQRAQREKCKGNIDKLLQTVNALLNKLSQIDNLPELLTYDDEEVSFNLYFTDFNTDKGDGYIDNNFGQDPRNFKNFLEYAKDKGATTVYFQYG